MALTSGAQPATVAVLTASMTQTGSWSTVSPLRTFIEVTPVQTLVQNLETMAQVFASDLRAQRYARL